MTRTVHRRVVAQYEALDTDNVFTNIICPAYHYESLILFTALARISRPMRADVLMQ